MVVNEGLQELRFGFFTRQDHACALHHHVGPSCRWMEEEIIGVFTVDAVLFERGKVKSEGRAFRYLRINRNKTAVPLDDRVANGKAQPKALLAVGIFRGKIRIEYPRDMFRLNAETCIPQGHFDVVPGGQQQAVIRGKVNIFSRDAQYASVRHRFFCVRHEIQKDLPHLLRVDRHGTEILWQLQLRSERSMVQDLFYALFDYSGDRSHYSCMLPSRGKGQETLTQFSGAETVLHRHGHGPVHQVIGLRFVFRDLDESDDGGSRAIQDGAVSDAPLQPFCAPHGIGSWQRRP